MSSFWIIFKTLWFAFISIATFSIFIIIEFFMANELIYMLHDEYGVENLYTLHISNFLDFIPSVTFLPMTINIPVDAVIFLTVTFLVLWEIFYFILRVIIRKVVGTIKGLFI